MRFHAILSKRKSVREYERKPVPKQILKELIRDATLAPSAGNKQPWEFHVITSKKTRDSIALLMRDVQKVFKGRTGLSSGINKVGYEFYYDLGGCPTIILVYMKREKELGRRINNYLSIAAAVENLNLSAVEKGLGACWMGSFKKYETKLNRMLGIKKDRELVTGIIVGYPKTGYIPLEREKKKLNEILKFA